MGDDLLASILRALETDGMDSGISIVFESGGSIFTGRTITTSAYFMAMGERFAKGFQGDAGDSFIGLFDQMATRAKEEQLLDYRYLHVRDGTAIAGDRTVSFPFWRVRLDQIGGFDFGSEGDPDAS